MPVETISYETPQFLHSMLGHDVEHLRVLGDAFGVHVTSRDSWVKFEGDESGIEKSKKVLTELEKVRRQGGEVTAELFHMIVDHAREPQNGMPVEHLMGLKLLGGARKSPVLAKTRGQIEYLRALRECEVVFGVGPAGTGKTFLAMAQALQCLRDKTIQRLVLTRPAVEAGEALGYLPGDLNEKVLPYLRPLYDALFELTDPEEAERMVERGIVEIAPLAYMRGRTLKNAFVILDEGQNTTPEQMFMFLTRLGEGSRCVVTGDPSQVDLRRGQKSGLVEAIEALNNVEGIRFVHLASSDAVRLPVVRRIIEAYKFHRQSGD